MTTIDRRGLLKHGLLGALGAGLWRWLPEAHGLTPSSAWARTSLGSTWSVGGATPSQPGSRWTS